MVVKTGPNRPVRPVQSGIRPPSGLDNPNNRPGIELPLKPENQLKTGQNWKKIGDLSVRYGLKQKPAFLGKRSKQRHFFQKNTNIEK